MQIYEELQARGLIAQVTNEVSSRSATSTSRRARDASRGRS